MKSQVLYSLLADPAFKSEVIYTTKHYNVNDKILTQNKDHRELYIIKGGKVRVTVHDIGDLHSLRPGITELGNDEIFGEFGLFDDLPASADVIAITACEVIEIDIPSLKKFLDQNPVFGYQIFLDILQTMVKRLRHADRTILHLYLWGVKAHQIDKHLSSEESSYP